MRLGIPCPDTKVPALGSLGFNEAEARAPRIGYATHPAIAHRYRTSFNEAEARAPRILAIARRAREISKSFNEAEARAPRISPHKREARTCQISASMRPRRVRLGYGSPPSRVGRRQSRFNEAEARAPRIPSASRQMAQIQQQASMRPRRVRLGYSRICADNKSAVF